MKNRDTTVDSWDFLESRIGKLGRKLDFARPGDEGFEALAEEYMRLREERGWSPWPMSSDRHATRMRRMLMTVRKEKGR